MWKGFGEFAIAVAVPDLRGVQPPHPALAIEGKAAGVGDAELARHDRDHVLGNVGRVGQEGPQEADRAELDGAPKAQDLLAAGIDELTVGIVQMEVPGDLLNRRGAGEPPVAVLCSAVRKRTGMAASQNSS